MLEDDTIHIDMGWSELPSDKHRQWMRWSPKISGIAALLGGWGSGKSVTALRRYALECLRRGWSEAYGVTNPSSVIMAPTTGVLRSATIPTLEKIVPNELIMKKTKTPPYTWEWVNGHMTYFFPAGGTIEGMNLTHFFLDEIQHDEYTMHPQRYQNMVARLRDPLALATPHPFIGLVAGLPRFGQVRQWFDVPNSDTMYVQRISAYDNRYLSTAAIDQLRAACTPDQRPTQIDGEWGSAPDSAFPTFDHGLHIVKDRGDKKRPVHLAIDLGRSGVCLVAQVIPKGLLVCDQLVSRDYGTDEVCEWVKKQGWVLTNESTVSIDPTARIDERRIITDMLPGARIVCRAPSDPLRDEERGLKYLARCLLDGSGKTSVWFSDSLDGVAQGVIESLTHARSNASTGKMLRTRDAGLGSDHPIDALRYMVCTVLAEAGRGPTMERL